eukprot:7597066-Alexandrium_andersonii.AAC.1
MGLFIEADKKTIGQALRPRQFAVGVSSSAEALARPPRPWPTPKGSPWPGWTANQPSTPRTGLSPQTAWTRCHQELPNFTGPHPSGGSKKAQAGTPCAATQAGPRVTRRPP